MQSKVRKTRSKERSKKVCLRLNHPAASHYSGRNQTRIHWVPIFTVVVRALSGLVSLYRQLAFAVETVIEVAAGVEIAASFGAEVVTVVEVAAVAFAIGRSVPAPASAACPPPWGFRSL